jgi:hypothetical protein
LQKDRGGESRKLSGDGRSRAPVHLRRKNMGNETYISEATYKITVNPAQTMARNTP